MILLLALFLLPSIICCSPSADTFQNDPPAKGWLFQELLPSSRENIQAELGALQQSAVWHRLHQTARDWRHRIFDPTKHYSPARYLNITFESIDPYRPLQELEQAIEDLENKITACEQLEPEETEQMLLMCLQFRRLLDESGIRAHVARVLAKQLKEESLQSLLKIRGLIASPRKLTKQQRHELETFICLRPGQVPSLDARGLYSSMQKKGLEKIIGAHQKKIVHQKQQLALLANQCCLVDTFSEVKAFVTYDKTIEAFGTWLE